MGAQYPLLASQSLPGEAAQILGPEAGCGEGARGNTSAEYS